MINKILGIITFISGVAFYFFKAGKDSVENKENKEVVKNVKLRNKIIKDTNSLSNSALDSKLQKWKKPASK